MTSRNAVDSHSEIRLQAESDAAQALVELGAMLTDAFGTELSILDGESGDLLYTATAHRGLDWLARAELCRTIARREEPELIEDDEPLVTLAIPLLAGERRVVAVGTFLSRPIGQETARADLARWLGMSAQALAAWLADQEVWPPRRLLGVARLLGDKLAAERGTASLEKELSSVSLNLATTYEEISLLYHLTQNLKLSSRTEQLGQVALEWLGDVLPVESLAMQLITVDRADDGARGATNDTVLLSHGPAPVDREGFARLVSHLEIKLDHRPTIINQSMTDEASWPFAGIRQAIIIPLSEGSNLFGYLAVFNHREGNELGTVEASLLTSVAAILGIHSGNIELYRQQAEFFNDVVRALTSAIDAKDPHTCGHSNRVGQVARRLAEELGGDSHMLGRIYLSGLLHDTGKIGIDDTVLRKEGRLTEAEYEHIKTHAEIGHRILAGLKQLDDVLPVVLHHHEQWDGKGYPHGLAGEQIPLMARIVAVADSFDAMTSDRPYRKGMPDERIDAIMREGAGGQWDARVVEAFFRARNDIREISERERGGVSLTVHPRP
ncbi:MAG TPA: HD domain-containing phosphohydrolase [Pirellulales bacterium]|nr:HD domain-containing phosphohydrolase [Pirellulales bacterium]